MTLFQPVDMMGPAHRGPAIQHLAQAAAQNVMRRQRMRALLQVGARQGAAPGPGQPFRSSMQTRPGGVHTSLPGGGLPGGGMGSQFAPGRGGFDFPSLQDPNDPSQSGPSTLPPPPSPPGQINPGSVPTGFTQPTSQIDPNGIPTGFSQPSGQIDPSAVPAGFSSGDTSGGSGLIPLGGGLFYDPVTDAVRGGPSR